MAALGRFSALGLHQQSPPAGASVTLTGAAAAAAAGAVVATAELNVATIVTGAAAAAAAGAVVATGEVNRPAFNTGRIGSLVLHQTSRFTGGATATVLGAQSNAASGNVSTNIVTGIRAITPIVLPGVPRVFSSRDIGPASVVLTGAEIRGQGEELEGANVTIRVEGASITTQAGNVESVQEGITGMSIEEWFMHRRQQARAQFGRTDRRPRKG